MAFTDHLNSPAKTTTKPSSSPIAFPDPSISTQGAAFDVFPPPLTTVQGTPSPSPAIVASVRPPSAAPQPHAPPQTQTQTPTPTMIATTDKLARGRKRNRAGSLEIKNSKYYKMRLILKDLRPHILEVVRSEDVKKSKAAKEIEEKMKLILELYEEMTGETAKRESAKRCHVVGGSALGWNFIMYGRTKPVYYGMSKEEYRKSKEKHANPEDNIKGKRKP